jgi:hypothetical protein
VTGADGVERRAVEPGHTRQLATRFGTNRPGPVLATVGAFPWGATLQGAGSAAGGTVEDPQSA